MNLSTKQKHQQTQKTNLLRCCEDKLEFKIKNIHTTVVVYLIMTYYCMYI